MYTHIGASRMVRTKSIIGIFDMDKTTVSQTTKAFLNKAEKDDKLISLTTDIPRSFVVTDDKIYISQISPTALSKR